MIKTWFKMKALEIRLKYQMCSFMNTLINDNKDYIDLIKRLTISLKDVPVDELQEKLVTEIASIVHAEAQKERESKQSE